MNLKTANRTVRAFAVVLFFVAVSPLAGGQDIPTRTVDAEKRAAIVNQVALTSCRTRANTVIDPQSCHRIREWPV